MAKKTKLRDVQVNCTGWVFDQPMICKATITHLIKNKRGTVTSYACDLHDSKGALIDEGIAFLRHQFYHAPDELPRLVDDIHEAIAMLLYDLKTFSAVLGSELKQSHPDDEQHVAKGVH